MVQTLQSLVLTGFLDRSAIWDIQTIAVFGVRLIPTGYYCRLLR